MKIDNTKSFSILSSMEYLAPCPAAEGSESLTVKVLHDGYLLEYRVVANGGFDNTMKIPFGFFASSKPETIAGKLNKITFRGEGFGIRISKPMTAEDVLGNDGLQKLISFDKARRK